MASLVDAAKATGALHELTGRLHAELTNGELDFSRLVMLADFVAEKGDMLATAFHEVDVALSRHLAGEERATAPASSEAERTGTAADDQSRNGSDSYGRLTREELYEQAREAAIPGRSTMSKPELIEALQGTKAARKP